jgi:P27 family predicted phage terminase small subunit
MPNPPKPTQLKLLQGNPGQRPLNTNEPVPPEGELLAPAWWPKRGDAETEWDRIVPILQSMRILTVADRTALVAYCEQWAMYCEAMQDIQAYGGLVEGQKGNLVRNPALQTARDCLSMVQSFCREFGMTPSSRSRISLPGTDSDQDAALAGILSN